MIITSSSEVETRSVGRRLASLLRPNDVVLLCGELGSGKTAFVAGLAEGLGVEDQVTSPSFVLVRRYRGGFIPLIHADVYRLGSLNELSDLDLLDEAENAILAVEWGNAVESAMPSQYLRVQFEVLEDGLREIGLVGHGPAWTDRSLEDVFE
ncbi:tRNA threonylcarbamoyladenosine biosynthesis protein TsaE [bacterium BMS3Abin02]|nr:tRNA threonylcarbamoyladenosine biosynthesis protein TsaE [bacterium BMS3Abin02]GBE21303.1 tRNA threonylcarbamoyladenosine biosynthesis protein TsaE [bacterium BMS3Bbin01]HDH27161.1 tRNA (adenosine(37)-N6)-threonylcarbamoyltransferase complex ATPase subunit type 1 TsaE [Actinomycetota bacterium]HDK46260.1 tRNA (adenosine(37)-N6)-threonylcarbamoyltransferase complex ATPase subunit type 1 TsaE [Actinomycetota bacterium]HDL48813.1 tRNA (adenosine(37)-N6)-threonylcarbamoyltransferase complex ATP